VKLRARAITIGILTLLGAVASGWFLHGARADGVAMVQPMTYTGILTQNGAPATGMHMIAIAIWDDPTSTDGTHLKCMTGGLTQINDGGRFSIALPDTCTAAVHKIPDLYLELAVEGNVIGRTKLGAVPYALEAAAAADASGALKAKIDTIIPPGTIIAYGGASIPNGWLACDGSEVGRTAYPGLFAAIGTGWGNGDGSTTFRLPDLRGRFLRGIDGGSHRDPDRNTRTASQAGGNVGDNVGSVQTDAIASHTHDVTDPGHDHTEQLGSGTTSGSVIWTGGGATSYMSFGASSVQTQGNTTGISIGGPSSGVSTSSETRPENASVVYLIKL
jgi:microcystin-dependent protein